MTVSIDVFKKKYSRALYEGHAAVFAGAGLSCASGYSNWKTLLKPLAEEIGLDVERERDLVAVAQYYRNEKGSRTELNEHILNEFTKCTPKNENVTIITRLPIYTYWTTNYDHLIEDGLIENKRNPDVKITEKSLASNKYDRDAVVYKMHGDISIAEEVVILRDDYEYYQNRRPLFRTVLKGDLVSKTFLFIGFSFEDPNLEYILSQIRILLEDNQRHHYCFFEKAKQKISESNEDFIYRKAKQDLKIKDLKRYGILTVLLDSYDEITGILKDIEHAYLLKTIFISGSIESYDSVWSKDRVESFVHNLGRALVSRNYRLVSGFGLGVGSSLINGALEIIMEEKFKHIDEHLCLRPFPQTQSGTTPIKELWTRYREEMISQAGIAVFVFGDKKDKAGNVLEATGMLEEFNIAKRMKKIIIPIPATDRVALKIFNEMFSSIHDYPYLAKYNGELKAANADIQLLEIIVKIIDEQQFI